MRNILYKVMARHRKRIGIMEENNKGQTNFVQNNTVFFFKYSIEFSRFNDCSQNWSFSFGRFVLKSWSPELPIRVSPKVSGFSLKIMARLFGLFIFFSWYYTENKNGAYLAYEKITKLRHNFSRINSCPYMYQYFSHI